MSRLHAELHRLYLAAPPAAADPQLSSPTLIGTDGRVRALVLELSRPASWEELSALWQGVQLELELPAPAIAVSGTEALQLWFSLAEPVAVSQAQAFLSAVRTRFMPDVAARRVRLWPVVEDAAFHAPRHVPLVPAEQAEPGHWSAFVKPELAPVFADTPWLDMPPSDDGQADLLSRLASITPSAFAAALQRLTPAASEGSEPTRTQLDPKRFLLHVMSDESVALALRIEAAKALLPFSERSPKG